MDEKSKKTNRPVHKKPLKEINIHVNEFGQIVRDVELEEIKKFLDENVPDKKLDEIADEPIDD